jgi:hypothetical protein
MYWGEPQAAALQFSTAGCDAWPGDVGLSDIEPRFICTACGKRGADVRPDFNWKGKAVALMGYR